MKVMLTGANGQLGYELQRSCPAAITLVSTDVAELDITQPNAIAAILDHYQPDVVINGAAYTAVDKAESEPELAEKINHYAAQYLAQATQQRSIKLIHISTDFIFDGQQTTPYSPDASANPLSVYGASKWRGEQAIQQHHTNALIIRTAWLYSTHGHNFVKTMLKLMATRESLGIIYDQIGTPTWAATLAQVIWRALATTHTGVWHCSDQGVASWYDFAVAIQEEALALGLLERAIPLRPLRTEAYPTPAKRPAFGLLDKSLMEQQLGIQLPYWRTNLREMLKQYRLTLGK